MRNVLIFVAILSIRFCLVALIVAVTFLMENLDSTAIATALPQIARSFAVVPTDVSIGMTAYLVTLTVFIPISGWIADRFGARTIFGTANRHFHFGFARLRTCE
jgi:MFS family permease